jgi:esterase/lipase superfamily enzyme
MGNDPLLEVLGEQGDVRRSGGVTEDLKLKEVLLAAPDVSRSVFENLAAKVRGLVRGGVTLYASANDRAMLASKKVASGLVRAGDVPKGIGPLIMAGVETIDVSEASTSFLSNNHSAFADRRHLVEDIKLLFERSKHPPDERFPVFRAVGEQPRQYWKYFSN